MHYAIIAAGEGSRLTGEGVATPKPLVQIGGEPLINRLIRIFEQNNAESISIILNSNIPALIEHVSNLKTEVKLNIVNKSTPSSMHSFYELSPYLNNKFCLTTIDTIFREEEFKTFITDFETSQNHAGAMVVTDYIDDEKPLYVSTDEELNITGFHDSHIEGIKYISGGIYALTSPALEVLNKCIESGISRMRNYQRALITAGLKLKAVPFTKVIDIDHATDIEKAEQFIKANNPQ